LSDEEIANRAKVKEEELQAVFKQVSFNTEGEDKKVAVLGCGDRRFIKYHQEVFSRLLGSDVVVTTLDITTDHLKGGDNVVKHDVAKRLPGGPYDITYGHVLLKFIETEKQWNVIENSIEALKEGGLAIHVLDKEDYETKDEKLSDGYYSVPIDRWRKKLEAERCDYMDIYEVPVKYGKVFVIEQERLWKPGG